MYMLDTNAVIMGIRHPDWPIVSKLEQHVGKDLYISDRCIGKPPLQKGPLKDVTVDVDKLGDNFFEAMGWYVDTGIPKKETLERLGGLECVIKDLYPED